MGESMEIKNEIIILRDFIKQDIEDRIYWETVENEWQLWDAPWEYDEGEEIFNPEKYREEKLAWIEKDKDNSRIRSVFQICINNKKKPHIGWCSWYYIDDSYEYTRKQGKCTIGIDIPPLSARHKGYATSAWVLFIQYLISKGIEDIYTQTWSGNKRLIGLATKLGFEECHRKIAFRKVRGEMYDGLTFRLNMNKFFRYINLAK